MVLSRPRLPLLEHIALVNVSWRLSLARLSLARLPNIGSSTCTMRQSIILLLLLAMSPSSGSPWSGTMLRATNAVSVSEQQLQMDFSPSTTPSPLSLSSLSQMKLGRRQEISGPLSPATCGFRTDTNGECLSRMREFSAPETSFSGKCRLT